MHWVRELLRARPKVRAGYRIYDMDTMDSWGFNAFWWPSGDEGERACIFSPYRPKVGDVVVAADMAYAVIEVDTPRDPGDQHFVRVKRWGEIDTLPLP